ncbi:hypothetical protein E3Q14_00707 [Wallemia mellicola]|nr:hypothetical protein E3Q14_00707 [Wallemia mellicola]
MQSALEESIKYVQKVQSLTINNESKAESVPFYKATNEDDQDWSMLVDDNAIVNDDDFDFFDESPKTATTQQTPITPFTPATPSIHYSFVDHTLEEFQMQPTNGVIPNGYQQLAFNRAISLVNYSANGKYAVEEGIQSRASYPPHWYESLSRPHLTRRKKKEKEKDSRMTFTKVIHDRSATPSSSSEYEIDEDAFINSSDDDFDIDTNLSVPPTPMTLHSNGSRLSEGAPEIVIQLSDEDRVLLSNISWSSAPKGYNIKFTPQDITSQYLTQPKLALGYDNQVIHTLPHGMQYWEKAGFTPFGGKKNIAVSIEGQRTELREAFFDTFRDMYTICNFGNVSVLHRQATLPDEHTVVFEITDVDFSTHLPRARQASQEGHTFQLLSSQEIQEVISSRDAARGLAIRIYDRIKLIVQKWAPKSQQLHQSVEAQSFDFPAFVIARNGISRDQIAIAAGIASAFNYHRKLHIAYIHLSSNRLLIVSIDEYSHFHDVQLVDKVGRTSKQTILEYFKVFELETSIRWSVRVITPSAIPNDDELGDWKATNADDLDLHFYTFNTLEGKHDANKADYGWEDNLNYATINSGCNRVLKITNHSTTINHNFENYIQSLHNLSFITKYKKHPRNEDNLPYHLHKLLTISQ